MFARAGRRTTLMLAPVLLASCSAITFLSSSAQPLYVARLLGGAGHGVGVSFASIYVAEVRPESPPRPSFLYFIPNLLFCR